MCRDLDSLDDLHFGVHEDMMYALNTPPVPGAQWTGIVTQIAIDMLESGQVEAVVCVQSDETDRFTPKPVSLPAAALFNYNLLAFSKQMTSRWVTCYSMHSRSEQKASPSYCLEYVWLSFSLQDPVAPVPVSVMRMLAFTSVGFSCENRENALRTSASAKKRGLLILHT